MADAEQPARRKGKFHAAPVDDALKAALRVKLPEKPERKSRPKKEPAKP